MGALSGFRLWDASGGGSSGVEIDSGFCKTEGLPPRNWRDETSFDWLIKPQASADEDEKDD